MEVGLGVKVVVKGTGDLWWWVLGPAGRRGLRLLRLLGSRGLCFSWVVGWGLGSWREGWHESRRSI